MTSVEMLANAKIMGATMYLCMNYPDKFASFDDLVNFSSVPHQDILKYIGLTKEIIGQVLKLKEVPELMKAGRIQEVDDILDKYQPIFGPYLENYRKCLNDQKSW